MLKRGSGEIQTFLHDLPEGQRGNEQRWTETRSWVAGGPRASATSPALTGLLGAHILHSVHLPLLSGSLTPSAPTSVILRVSLSPVEDARQYIR